MKYLITICGKWTDDFKSKFQSFIKYVPFDLKDCDIIVASDKEQNIEWLKCSNLTQVSVIDDCDHIFHHTEWEQHSGNIFSYKCLEYANHIKNKIELKKLELYDVCFFVDANDFDDIEFGKEFVYPNTRQVITSNINEISKSLSRFSETKIKIIPTSFWYSKSIDFNIISQFWKGNHYKFPKNLETSKYRFLLSSNYKFGDYPKYDIAFYNFLRKLHFRVGVI